jgi:hypothetical protein
LPTAAFSRLRRKYDEDTVSRLPLTIKEMPLDLSRLNLIPQLIGPIQELIRRILPEFAEENLEKPEVREAIVVAVDKALVANYPMAAAIPASFRRKIIRKQVDMIIDDIVLGPAEAFSNLAPPPSSQQSRT